MEVFNKINLQFYIPTIISTNSNMFRFKSTHIRAVGDGC